MSLIEIVTKENCEDIKKIIVENPELPLLTFASNDFCTSDSAYTQLPASIAVERVTFHRDTWMDEEQYELEVRDDLSWVYEGFAPIEEVDRAVEEVMNKTEFIKAICIMVG